MSYVLLAKCQHNAFIMPKNNSSIITTVLTYIKNKYYEHRYVASGYQCYRHHIKVTGDALNIEYYFW